MSKAILEIENVSKQYRLGYVGTGTLSDDMKRWWYRMWGKEDPFMKIGEENKRGEAGDSEYVWALHDINLQVHEGEVLGIIGANGAGKSTLLKLLSRVTGPTTGKITTRGRIASLLEVGTGFHPELTGRENIYLNGAILGMTKQEINSKLDEIIDFSGCERYIDTPVKRYSSGMNVRLGFAVAAHLEPEILIVDEVLAVGDIEFQKKAIGKMKDVSSGQGRTVLFVSHNMDSIERLCERTVLLKNGKVHKIGETSEIISDYLKNTNPLCSKKIFSSKQHQSVFLKECYVHNEDNVISDTFDITKKIGITAVYESYTDSDFFICSLELYNEQENVVFISHDVKCSYNFKKRTKSKYKTTVWIPENLLAEGFFSINFGIFNQLPFNLFIYEPNVIKFKVVDYLRGDSSRGRYNSIFPGSVRPMLKWSTKKT
jgi:lipopolysaccharide transport system ATP-binding protein